MAANVDHAAISKMALPDLSAPEKATLASKTGLTEDKATYSDARGLDGSWENAFQTIPDVLFFDTEKICLAIFFQKFPASDQERAILEDPRIFVRHRQIRLEK